jgi:hypothetical protein
MATPKRAKVETKTNVPELPELAAPPKYELIASRAYALWQARGCPEGSPEVDWFQAEQELKTSR